MRPARLAAVAAAAIGATGALSAATASADHADHPRLRVCAAHLKVDLEPDQHWTGTLDRHESFRVSKRSDSGKYAYGFAYGHINRMGWVRSSGLCDDDARASAGSASVVGDRVAVRRDLYVREEPNQGWSGVLEPPETFHVEKLSDSGKYAYGFAYGHIDRRGWVLTSGLS
jgi:hypothetical protein